MTGSNSSRRDDWLQRFWADARQGKLKTEEEYRELFPDLETEIAAEFADLCTFEAAVSETVEVDRDRVLAAATMDLPSGRIGRYNVLARLGSGGQGAVFLAVDPELGRKVAIKILSMGHAVSPAARARFRREAETAGRLSHPGIAAVHEIGEDEGLLYIAMEYVPGQTLADRIHRGAIGQLAEQSTAVAARKEAESGTIDSAPQTAGSAASGSSERREILDLVTMIEYTSRSLHVAHAAKLVHRDIKPSNVIVKPDGATVILDFGLARDENDGDAGITLDGDVIGTPAYMSPEQIRGDWQQVDARTDVYALGVTLFEAVTRQRPFQRKTRRDLYAAIADEEPPSPRVLNPRVPRDLEAIILTALDKDPHRRYSTALDFAEDLRRFRALEPVKARPAGWTVRLRRWSQRNPVMAVILVVLALVLVGSSVFFASNSRRLGRLNSQLLGRKAAAEEAARQAQASDRRAQEYLADTSLVAGELAARHGDWEEAIARYEVALERGHPDPDRISIRLVEAAYGMLDSASAARYLATLEVDVDSPHAAVVKLLRGDLLVDRVSDPEGGLDLVREAIADGGLPPADQAYAEAIFASTIPESLVLLDRALEIDPAHRLSIEMKIGICLSAGRMDECRDFAERVRFLYPGDPLANYALVVVAATENPDGDWSTDLDAVCARVGSSHASAMRNMIEVILMVTEFMDLTHERAFGGEASGPGGTLGRLQKFMKKRAAPLFDRLQEQTEDSEASEHVLLRLPPCAVHYVDAWVTACGADELFSGQKKMNLMSMMSVFRRAAGLRNEDLDAILELNPEDSGALVFRAVGHMKAEEYEQALSKAHKAMDTDGVFDLRRLATSWVLIAARVWSEAGMPEEARERAREAVLYASARVIQKPRSTATEFQAAARAALAVDEPARALEVANAWRRALPESLEAMEVEGLANEACDRALVAEAIYREILKRDAEHPGAMERLRQLETER